MLLQVYGEDGNEGQHQDCTNTVKYFVARHLLRRLKMCVEHKFWWGEGLGLVDDAANLSCHFRTVLQVVLMLGPL